MFWVISVWSRPAARARRGLGGRRWARPRTPAIRPARQARSADRRIGEVVRDVGGLLGGRVLGPEALGPAEVRDAAVGADPRAGEHHDLPAAASQARTSVQILVEARTPPGYRPLDGGSRRGSKLHDMQPTLDRRPDPPPTFPIATLTVRPWPDAVIDAVGHEARSPYVERFWLGVLGPSSTWLLRRLVARLDDEPDGLRARPRPHRHRSWAGRTVGAALAVLAVDRPVLPVRRRPAGRRDHPAGAPQAPAAHPDPAGPAARQPCRRPTRRGRIRRRRPPVDEPARASPRPASPCSSWARTRRPPSASSTHGGSPRHRPRGRGVGRRAPPQVTQRVAARTTSRPRRPEAALGNPGVGFVYGRGSRLHEGADAEAGAALDHSPSTSDESAGPAMSRCAHGIPSPTNSRRKSPAASAPP